MKTDERLEFAVALIQLVLDAVVETPEQFHAVKRLAKPFRHPGTNTAPVSESTQVQVAVAPVAPIPPPVPSKPLLTKRQIASFLQLTPRTVELWMQRGLPHYRLGERRTRFDLEQVKLFLKANFAVIRG